VTVSSSFNDQIRYIIFSSLGEHGLAERVKQVGISASTSSAQLSVRKLKSLIIAECIILMGCKVLCRLNEPNIAVKTLFPEK
jgi:hypothetical protein